MVEFPLVTLGDHAKIESGYAFRSADWLENGVPVVKITSISGGRLTRNGLGFVDAETARKANRFSLKNGDVLVAMTGASLGSMAMVRSDDLPLLLNQRVGRIAATSNQIEEKYLYFVLSSGNGSEQLKNLGHGSAQPNLSSGDFGRILVPLPPLAEQREIAGVLGAIDDKIEANRRQLEILDLICQEEWRMRISTFGTETKKLGEICTSQYGLNGAAEKSDVGPKFLRVMDINKSNWIDWSSVPYVPVSGVEHLRYKLNRGDIVIARMADPGKSAIIDEDRIEAAFASYLVRFVAPTIEDAYFLYGHLKSQAFRDFSESTSTGSVQKNMNAQVIGSADVPWPSSSLRQEFASVIMPLREKIVQNVRENQKLSELRDTLLPELLSGRLRVKGAESIVENV